MSEADREKWDARYRESAPGAEPSLWLCSLDALLPRSGKALDVAGGSGKDARWLAQRGLDVTLADISEVGLALATEAAKRDCVRLEVRRIDLETEPFPQGTWDLITCSYYLHRPLYAPFVASLAPGGMLVVVHPTRSNLLRHPKPSARFLLQDGELASLVAGLQVLKLDEGWGEAGRHEARLLAQKIRE